MKSDNSLNYRRGAIFFLTFFFAMQFMPAIGNLSPFNRLIMSFTLVHLVGGYLAVKLASKGFGGNIRELLQIKRPEKGFWKDSIKGTCIAYAALVATMILSVAVMKMFGFEPTGHPIGQISQSFTSIWQWAVVLLMGGVIAPLVEEIIFRRFIFQTALAAGGEERAYFTTCVLFSLIHFVPVGFLSYYLIAFILQRSMQQKKNLLYPYMIHAMFNCMQIIFLFIKLRYFNHA